MQQKEIKYTGITTIPSDYDCPDGDISAMINLVNENGNLSPVAPPEALFTLSDNQKVLYIHKTSDYCNYIVHDTNEENICYFAKSPTETKDITAIANKELYQINSIGNTLVILTGEGIIYALYKSGNYVIMGDKPEFPSISFRLQGTRKNSESITSSFSAGGVYNGLTSSYMLTDEAVQATQNVIFAYINSDSANTKNLNRFQYPFMIRYAYRLYDESLYILSAPIKMTPSEGVPYLARVAGFNTYNGLVNGINMVIFSLSSSLYYEIINFDQIKESLANWTDLVKSIDIFITPNLNEVNQENSCHSIGLYGWATPPRYESAFVRANMSIGEKDTSGEIIHREYDMAEIWGDNISQQMFLGIGSKEFLPTDGTLPFRLISSIDIKKIEKGVKILPIESGVLNGWDNRELMEGDSQKDGTIIAKHAFAYNSRLNLANITVIPPRYPLESCFQYINGEYDTALKKGIKKVYKHKAYVFIESEKQDIMIDTISNIDTNILTSSFFFYPNPKAFKLIIEREDTSGTKTYSNTKLTEHKSLNGAYTDGLAIFKSDFDTSILSNTSRGIPYYNKIYTSEVNNPFSFPATGVNTIGSGEILGIRSATKALSQGQFGQFPLYAFTDEGIWALEVSSEGKFIAKQPATRDVCSNPDSITQIDTSVLFTSERGIMLIQGSESVCISEVLNEKSFDISTLKGYEQLIQMADLTAENFKHSNFIEYIKGCAMAYDYTNQRIIVFNKEYSYAYVFSLQSKTWGMIPSDFTNSVNSYPDSYIMTKSNTLVNLSNTGNGNSKEVKGMIITRPLKLDSPDLLKTITQSMHRGVFRKGKVKTVLYGSRDCINFVPITSSLDHTLRSVHGSPYKYFRFAIITELLPGESLSGTSIIFETRQTNKLR